MSRQWQQRANDILEAIARVEEYVQGLDDAAFMKDKLRQDAVIRNLEVIGEAARAIPEEVLELQASIPWSQIRRMRNVLAHVYFGVNLAIVWDTIQQDLPPLKVAVAALLASSTQSEP